MRFVILQYPPHRLGEFLVAVDRVVLVEYFGYSDHEGEYEGSRIHLDTGQEIECALDVDGVKTLLEDPA